VIRYFGVYLLREQAARLLAVPSRGEEVFSSGSARAALRGSR
jgi:hypothetical protein